MKGEVIADLADPRLETLPEPVRAALAAFEPLAHELSAQGLTVALLVGQAGHPPFPTVVEGDPLTLHAMVLNLLAQLPQMQAQERGEPVGSLAAQTAHDLEAICRARDVAATFLLTDALLPEQGQTAMHLPQDPILRTAHLMLLSRLLQTLSCQCDDCRAARETQAFSPDKVVH